MPPSYRGGTEEYAYQLARSYSEVRPVRVVTTSARWTETGAALSIGTSSMVRIPAREILERPVLTGPGAWSQLKREVRAASVVQLHMPFPWVERQVTKWARAAGVPSVLTYHMDAEFGRNPQAASARFVSGAYRSISCLPALRNCDVAVSNSLGYAKASPVLSKFLPKVRVIYQGVDLERLRPTGPEGTDEVPPRTPGVARVLFIGRLVPYKGLLDVLEAVKRLTAAGRPVELLIGGKGPQTDELKARTAALGLADQVRFLGFVPDGAVGRLYRDSDVVVCPSISLLESTPITLQEAMTFGTPVIGTTLAGTEESIPNDGVRGRLVPPKDPAALAGALAELIDRGRPPSSTPARSWADTAHEYLALFDELEGRRRAG
jgi:glycosyltransferase involved in cell wall biosynthesis